MATFSWILLTLIGGYIAMLGVYGYVQPHVYGDILTKATLRRDWQDVATHDPALAELLIIVIKGMEIALTCTGVLAACVAATAFRAGASWAWAALAFTHTFCWVGDALLERQLGERAFVLHDLVLLALSWLGLGLGVIAL